MTKLLAPYSDTMELVDILYEFQCVVNIAGMANVVQVHVRDIKSGEHKITLVPSASIERA